MSHFCIVDKKKDCFSIYMDGKFYDHVPEDAMHTWSYMKDLDDRTQLASIYCRTNSLDKVCPDHLKDEWKRVSDRMAAFGNSIRQAKINMSETCLRDLIPDYVLGDFCETKIKIIKHAFKNNERPRNYGFLYRVSHMLWKISQQRLNLDIRPVFLKRQEKKAQEVLKNVDFSNAYVNYNLFGAITGRLSTVKGTFPILNLKKDYRSCILPTNDFFVEFDINSAELRMALALLGEEQPEQDLHEWNIENVFQQEMTRTEAKEKVFQYLYNPKVRNSQLEEMYNRDKIINKYWNGQQVENFLGRVIPTDSRHYAINYIIQSSTSDLVLLQALHLFSALANCKSFLAFMIHDSVIIDVANEEKHFVKEWAQEFSETTFGNFKTNIAVGENFGEMKKI